MAFEVFKFDDLATLINGRAYLMPELQDSGKYRIVRVGNFSGKDEWFWSDMELDEDKYYDITWVDDLGNVITTQSLKEGTLPTYIYTNDEFDTSDAVAVVKWSNKKTTYVDAKDLTFDMKSLDLSTVGEKELAITYNNFNFTYCKLNRD